MRAAALALATGLTLLAQAGKVEVWTAAGMKSSAGPLAPEAEATNIAGKTLGAWGTHSASLWRRNRSGEAELHKTKTDLLVVQEGTATLETGGMIPDAHPTTAGEIRGASIRGGESHLIGPGDIIRIPPGTPHRFVLAKGQFIVYFALKLAR